MKNANFKEIIRRELDLMFGVDKPKRSAAMAGEESSAIDKDFDLEGKLEDSSSNSLSSASEQELPPPKTHN